MNKSLFKSKANMIWRNCSLESKFNIFKIKLSQVAGTANILYTIINEIVS